MPTETLAVPGGRTLFVPKSLKGVAVFSFARLCRQPLGAADYLAIARHFHTVFLVGIPVMGPENRNEAARFVTLIDALYEYKVKLLASADAGAGAAVPGRRWRLRVRTHRFAADGDAIGGLHGAGTWRLGRLRLRRGPP